MKKRFTRSSALVVAGNNIDFSIKVDPGTIHSPVAPPRDYFAVSMDSGRFNDENQVSFDVEGGYKELTEFFAEIEGCLEDLKKRCDTLYKES